VLAEEQVKNDGTGGANWFCVDGNYIYVGIGRGCELGV
jgi:hypothetical protein